MAPDPFDNVPMSTSLQQLARRGVLKSFKKGTQFINEGEHSDTLFIVLSGRVQAFSENADGKTLVFNEYGPGEYVGEMSLDGGPRSASVKAIAATQCAMVTRHTLQQHLAEDPAFAFELLAKVIRRARGMTTSLRQIALNNVYGRLKDLLEAHAGLQSDGTHLWQGAPTQVAMAQQLGCTKEMVNKVMKDWQRGAYVSFGPGWVRVMKGLPAKW